MSCTNVVMRQQQRADRRAAENPMLDVLAVCPPGYKHCTKCRRTLWNLAFHKDRSRKDEMTVWCKSCTSKKTAAWAKKNRKRKNKTDRNWKRRNRQKDRARGKVRTALRNGTLVQPNCCDCCVTCDVLEAHHRDYSKPLDVIWLCKRCHAFEHEWGRRRRT